MTVFRVRELRKAFKEGVGEGLRKIHNECFVIITPKLLLGSPNHGGRDGRSM